MERLLIFILIFAVSKLIAAVARNRQTPAQPPNQAGPPVAGQPRGGKTPRRSQQPQTQPNRRKPTPASTDGQRRNQTSLSNAEPATTASGAGVRQHVETWITDHVRTHLDSQVDDSVQRNIGQHVQSHLGSDLTASPTASQTAPNQTVAIRELLRSPAGVRNAILVNELLAKPRALRK
jgi:hypothetical protein